MNDFKKIIIGFLVLVSVSACSRSSTTMLVPKGVIPVVDHTEKPKDLEYFTPKVDILFVIDSSGSMQTAQANLKANAYKFAAALSKVAILDYHVGILTTDMDDCRDNCGRLQGMPSFVERSTPNVVQVLSDKMVVGINGSAEEMMFSPVIEALSPQLENTTNLGFYRQDAYLAVIMITDAKEQSNFSPQDMMAFLTQKKGDKKKVLAYGAIRKLAERDICTTGGESLDDKLEIFFANVVNGNAKQDNVLSLCATDWGEKLAEFAKDIVTRSAGSVKLTALPSPSSIRVAFGTQIIPNDLKTGWTYRSSSNTLEFGSNIVWSSQPAGTTLSINYEIIDTE
jgi:hypothetical protein